MAYQPMYNPYGYAQQPGYNPYGYAQQPAQQPGFYGYNAGYVYQGFQGQMQIGQPQLRPVVQKPQATTPSMQTIQRTNKIAAKTTCEPTHP